MNQTTMPGFSELDQALSQTSLKLHPSEVHGIITGLLCGQSDKRKSWKELIVKGEDSIKIHDLLQTLFDASARELGDFLFQFQLLLPADDEDLSYRAEAMTLWCQGFLAGLKMADVKITGREPSDVTEAIDDIVEIAKMNYEDVIASDEDESSYLELVEYVRMAVILVYQDSHGLDEMEIHSGMSKHLH